jgi:hypothetical protein
VIDMGHPPDALAIALGVLTIRRLRRRRQSCAQLFPQSPPRHSPVQHSAL